MRLLLSSLCLFLFLSFAHAADDAALPTNVLRFKSWQTAAGGEVLSRHRDGGRASGDDDDDDASSPSSWSPSSFCLCFSRPGGASLTPGCLPTTDVTIATITTITDTTGGSDGDGDGDDGDNDDDDDLLLLFYL